ncbi:MAG: hypothetical protein K9J16_17945 [Melioribacteraceae bacterium]|nr:hypothetical protein [Melioribacteraceae bacterium]MCF8356710.1 hypothetical protein [Melioribacteraceae bacterium]MCF8396094.1 hypothetical protein [Melioribacteraceae bacterium]MCF8421080.1 hypothetical protein [Melioribacteraceae bacterium]
MSIYKKTKDDYREMLYLWIGSLIVLPFAIYFALTPHDYYPVLYEFNTLIHESGHAIFKFFGRFMMVLGGTLMQIIMPAIFIYYFFSNSKRIGVQFSVLWLGQNLINISVYASDAKAQKLPLIGGIGKEYHDWTYLLTETGLLLKDQTVGLVFYSLGIAAFIAAILTPLYMKEYKKVNIDLNI